MTEECFLELESSARKQLPNKALFADGIFYTAMMESNTWIKKGVDAEIADGAKVLKCRFQMRSGEWELITINDIDVEELID